MTKQIRFKTSQSLLRQTLIVREDEPHRVRDYWLYWLFSCELFAG